MKKQHRLIGSSIGLYILVMSIFLGSWYWDIGLPHIEMRLLLPLLLVVKDICLYSKASLVLVTREALWEKIHIDRSLGIVPWRYPLVLTNRMYVFPFLVAAYLLYLVVQQTGLWDLDYSMLFLSLDEQLLLLFIIASGICLVFGQEFDDMYQVKVSNTYIVWGYVFFSFLLGFLGGYLILQKTLFLGREGIVMANVSGVLIFLGGFFFLRK